MNVAVSASSVTLSDDYMLQQGRHKASIDVLDNRDGSQKEQGCRESFGPLGDQEAPPKRHSVEAPIFPLTNTIIHNRLLIKMAMIAKFDIKFDVKHCATASVRHSTGGPRSTRRIRATQRITTAR
jgi:hypothetical protein